MLPPKQLRIILILAILYIFLPIDRSVAQHPGGNSISLIFPFLSDMEEPGKIISGKLEKVFAEHGIANDRFAPLALIAAPAEFPEKEIIVITFLYARALPTEITEVIKKNTDSIYAAVRKEKISAGGRDVRWELLHDQLIDYRKIGMTGNYKTIITDRDNIDDDLNNFVEEVIKYEFSGNSSSRPGN